MRLPVKVGVMKVLMRMMLKVPRRVKVKETMRMKLSVKARAKSLIKSEDVRAIFSFNSIVCLYF